MGTDPNLHDDIVVLSDKINGLTERFSAKEELAKKAKEASDTTARIVKENQDRERNNKIFIGIVLGLMIIGLVVSGVSLHKSNNIIDTLKTNGKTQCLNANESRKFNTDMWDYILGHELGDTSKAQAPDEIVMSEQILPKIHYANRPRDCNHLGKKYPNPNVPCPPKGCVVIVNGKAVLVPMRENR